jgi:uncharacterized membrane protein YphA (DoxX/SURF4 family)
MEAVAEVAAAELDIRMSDRDLCSRFGIYAYAFGSLTAGIFDLIWRDFDSAHQPIQAWGDHIPGVTIFACITGVWMIAGGIAILSPRSARAGGAMLAVIYFIFTIFWLPRFYTAPHYLGVTIAVYIGVFAGTATELIPFAAGLLIFASSAPGELSRVRILLSARWIFGVCSISFGLGHLLFTKDDTVYVPAWMPFGQGFWVIFTGVCFILAGLAILWAILDVLAARLLGLMLLVFNLTILPSFIFADPRGHAAWGGSAYNLAAAGSAWILADAIASGKRHFAPEQQR